VQQGSIIHVLADAREAGMESFLSELTHDVPHAVRPVSPAQWFIVDDKPMDDEEFRGVCERLQPRAVGVDQSHGRVRIRIQGRAVERVLAKGTAVDLSPTAFAVGQSATTLIGHIAAHVTRVADDAFEIIVLRGFAESLWDDLARMSAEFA
jgi:sarcosine oxidase subunit gamma